MLTQLANGAWQVDPSGNPVRGEFQPPGDRQLSHMAIIMGALAVGPVLIQGALECADIVSTRRVLAHLGVSFTTDDSGWLVVSRPEGALTRPEGDLDCARSTACLRFMLALLSGQKFSCLLGGDAELWSEPLGQMLTPLRQMGAQIECLGGADRLPMRIKGQPLYPLQAELDPAAASAHDPLLLACLFAVGESTLVEDAPGPDHLERLLRHLGAGIRRSGLSLSLKGEQRLYPKRIKLPGDLSAAAPFVLAATLLPDSELWIHEVGTNPGRTGFLKTLARAGGILERQRAWQFGAEPVGSFLVRHTRKISAFSVPPNLAPSLLDEFFLLALLATQADGVSTLKGGRALSTGQPDALLLATQMLQAFGADVEYSSDGLRIQGPCRLSGAEVQCANDPRLAMLGVVAGLIAQGSSILHGAEALHDYYPGFMSSANRLLTRASTQEADTGDTNRSGTSS